MAARNFKTNTTETVTQLITDNPGQVAFVINFSGGKDSTSALAMVTRQFPTVPTYVVFADTGWEYPDAEDWSRSVVDEIAGLDLSVVASPKDFFHRVRARKMFPSSACRWCTSDLKRDPIYKWVRNTITQPIIINVMGIRADESASRAKKSPWALNKRLTTKTTRTVYDWLPIHHWTTEEVFTFIRTEGLPLHPVYQWLPRFSCRVCIYMSDQNILAVAQNDPEAFQKAADLEEEIGFTMKPGKSLKEVVAEAELVSLEATEEEGNEEETAEADTMVVEAQAEERKEAMNTAATVNRPQLPIISSQTAAELKEAFGPCSDVYESMTVEEVVTEITCMAQGKAFLWGRPWLTCCFADEVKPMDRDKAIRKWIQDKIDGQAVRDEVSLDEEAYTWDCSAEEHKARWDSRVKESKAMLKQIRDGLKKAGFLPPRAGITLAKMKALESYGYTFRDDFYNRFANVYRESIYVDWVASHSLDDLETLLAARKYAC